MVDSELLMMPKWKSFARKPRVAHHVRVYPNQREVQSDCNVSFKEERLVDPPEGVPQCKICLRSIAAKEKQDATVVTQTTFPYSTLRG